MIIIADQILLYYKIHVLLLLFFCDVIFKFCIEHPEKKILEPPLLGQPKSQDRLCSWLMMRRGGHGKG